MERKTEVLNTLRPLTDDERLEARDVARKNAVAAYGHEPQWEQYERVQVNDFPDWITRVVSGLLLVVFIAAANVSLFRVFTAGRDHYLETMPNEVTQAAAVGFSTFLLAEFMVIVSVVARRVLFRDNRIVQRVLWIPVVMGILMAFVGNWTITQPRTFWGVLETGVPPLAVLFMSIILEEMLLRSVGQRHAAKVAYTEALVEWRAKTNDPEALPRHRLS